MGITGVAKTGLQNQLPRTLFIEVTSKTDNLQDVRNFVNNIPQEAATKPKLNKLIAETPEDIADLVDKDKLRIAEDIIQNTEVGKHIASTSLDFAKKAGKFTFSGTMKALAPGDYIIEAGLRKTLPKLGLAAISGTALAAYTAYELALMAADIGKGLAFAKQQDNGDSFLKNFWEGFSSEDSYSDKYSIGYKLTKEIHNTLFDEVYGKMNQNVYAGANS